ncbi:hypothetical protein M378DRAFT_167640 [Amanita muscaria Koide BX008]|uniref:Uncharacterized protein n=1 Tax=Amanita muscaria (strain Koide BX008) TaxID=946122 RepID=A0A0C2SCW5_AMAMK|nr:hypothetical protein M378DRAFT_167640 [Amanita muscaria Koide BX008]
MSISCPKTALQRVVLTRSRANNDEGCSVRGFPSPKAIRLATPNRNFFNLMLHCKCMN